MYGAWGFRDSVNVDSGLASEYYLSLDQGMVMAASATRSVTTSARGLRHAATGAPCAR